MFFLNSQNSVAMKQKMRDELDFRFEKSADAVQIWSVRVELLEVKFGVIDYFEWLSLRNARVFQVRLVQSQFVYHYGVVCASSWVKVDSVEIYHLEYN